MKISLIGMTGSGKSYWSQKLEKRGFTRLSIDELLEKQLTAGLQQLGYSGLTDLAKWMRQPYAPHYARTSAIYLKYEKKALLDALSIVENANENENIVIDTTGSVIYLEEPLLQQLAKLTRILYLHIPQSVQESMYDLYIKDPKPVIWGDKFVQKANESPVESLRRCYPELLAYRTKRYEKLADNTFDYFVVRSPHFTVEEFIKQIIL